MHVQPHVRSTHQTVQTGNIRRPYQGGIVLAGQDDQQTGRSAPISHHIEQSAVRAALVELAGRQSIEQVPDEGGNVQPKGQEPPAGLEDHEEEADEGEDDPSIADEVWHVQEDIACCCWHVGWLRRETCSSSYFDCSRVSRVGGAALIGLIRHYLFAPASGIARRSFLSGTRSSESILHTYR